MRIAIATALVLAGCAVVPVGGPYTEATMMPLATDLTKLTAAVESTLLYAPLAARLADDQLLSSSVADDPGLLAPFRHYQLQVSRAAGHVALLVCSPDGRQALLEDAGCTAAMDRHRWRDQPPGPCTFTLDLQQTCAVTTK